MRAVAAVRYEGVAQTIVRAVKYGGWRHLAEVCAEKMEPVLGNEDTLPDLLVPVPLHRTRLRERGFNQAEAIAEALAARLGVPVVRGIFRARPTTPQVGLGRAARRSNVAGAFRAAEALREGAVVGMIDDVATSGATLRSAGETLLASGASRVLGVTFALALEGLRG